MKIVYIQKKWFVLIAVCIGLSAGAWYMAKPSAVQTVTPTAANEFVINMVTGEFKSTTEDGKEIEAYRWDPGTIYVPKDQPIKLSIYGVNGKEHPFHIEGTDIKGIVKKGSETVLDLRFSKEGIYRLICDIHSDIEHNGPMIAYIVVD
ncbi:heme/copper-type cytochrome/quinol oxidase subunit 2 [Bacillus fengqiuensis]|nr:heme/copper-type cytochrome/quinol oxidase subunit 2 [Bacillus fengqiuensis]